MCMSTSQPFAFPFSLEILNTPVSLPAPSKYEHKIQALSPPYQLTFFFSWHLQVN